MFSDSAIVVENVSKIYPIYKKPIERLKQFIGKEQIVQYFSALDNISINVKKGSTVGIIGRNGSGKSTLLQIIAGTLTPTSGRVTVNGRVAALLELGAGFNPEFTGRENVYLNASILGISEEETKERFQEILDFAEIGDFIDRPVKTYSSGMFVRLAFSIATLTDPDIVIIDEALSVGDEKFQRKCYNHLESLKEKGCTILFVSHSMKTVEQICDYAYLLNQGTLIGEGKPKEVIDQYHLMLYSQENDHMKVMNLQSHSEKASTMGSVSRKDDSPKESNEPEKNQPTRITSIKMYNDRDEESYVFYTGQRSKIVATIETDIPQSDVIVGIRIKTTQGVEVYGTSSAYYDIVFELTPNKKKQISFSQNLELTAGTYHVSIAVAVREGKNDMIYLDKLSDFLIFKVEEIPTTGTGIANLRSNIEISEV